MTHHRTLCSMELIDCKYTMAGCNIKHLRKDMPLHEDDTKVHFTTVFDALQIAQEKQFEAEQYKVRALARIEEQDLIFDEAQQEISRLSKLVESVKSKENTIREYSSFAFEVPISQLKRRIKTKLFNFLGHRFSLELEPHDVPGGYSVTFNNEDFKNADSITPRVVVKLLSHLASHRSKREFFHLEFKPDSYKKINHFIGTAELESNAYVRDGKIFLRATITLPPDQNLNRELTFSNK
jgi:hypothetical protein